MPISIKTTKTFRLAKSFAALPLILSITACDGGGGDVSSGENSIINRNTVIQTTESSHETTTVAGTITQIDTVRKDSGIELSQTPQTSTSTQNNAEAASSIVYVRVQELQNDTDARYRVHHSTDDAKYITTLTINAENTSALDDIAKAEQITGLSTDNLVLADEHRLSNILLQLEYLAGLTTPATMDSTKATITQSIAEETADIRNLKDTVTTVLADYKAGEAPEQTLIATLAEMEAGLAQAATIGDILLQEFDTTLDALIDELPEDLSLTYDSAQGRYTRFTHESLGQYTETGQWQFDPAYDWLNAALLMKDAE